MPPENTPEKHPIKSHRWLNKTVYTLCVVFFISSIVMLFLWKPWQANVKASDRTITVTGDVTLTATPDEYVFTPSYDFNNPTSQTALTDMTNKSNEIVTKLKALGVSDSAIKSDSSGNSGTDGIYTPVIQDNGSTTYTLNLTITIDNAGLAQKVLNYLVSTNPTGSVSPEPTFSTAKQKTLEDQARNQAEQNARSKANQSAKNLGFKVLAVKTVQDGSLGGPILPIEGGAATDLSGQANSPSLILQPGQNTLNYSVDVVYYIH